MRPSTAHATATALLIAATLAGTLPAQDSARGGDLHLVGARKSAGTAFGLSLTFTALPLFMASRSNNSDAGPILFGAILGPAIGHFYAGNRERALGGIALRAGMLGVTALLVSADCSNNGGWFCGLGSALLGATAIFISDLIDVFGAAGSATHYNQTHAGVALVPLSNGPESRLGIGIRLGP